MFDRFTERARQVLVLAQEEARKRKHHYVGTEHILLGLLHEGEGVASKALASLGIGLEASRSALQQIVPDGETTLEGNYPYTSRAQKVLELALREALSLGHNYIGTEHVLLGLVRENEGVAARLLDDYANAEEIRKAVLGVLWGPARTAKAVETLRPLPHHRAFERLSVFRITTAEGEGRNGDPVREVRRYYTDDGELLFTEDPVS